VQPASWMTKLHLPVRSHARRHRRHSCLFATGLLLGSIGRGRRQIQLIERRLCERQRRFLGEILARSARSAEGSISAAQAGRSGMGGSGRLADARRRSTPKSHRAYSSQPLSPGEGRHDHLLSS
jgi:hypothetical protein